MAGKKAKPKKVAKRTDSSANFKPTTVLCPICRTILIQPVTLPCDHAFCKQCFEDTMENANLVCPLCRLRVGSWFRRAKKEGNIVDEELWNTIQQQYPSEIRNKHQGIDNDIEEDKPVIIVANPGEIRKEYEKERQKDLEEQKKAREAEEKASAALIKKINEEEEYKKQVEEEKLRLDALLAKKLADDLNSPSTSKISPRRSVKIDNVKTFGPMDRFIKTVDSMASRRISQKKTELTKMFPIKSNTKSLSASPKGSKLKAGKDYISHVLPVEQNPMRVNRGNNLFADLDIKGIFGTLGQKITKTTDRDRRKSMCTSGYKSSGSGDHSDVIDQECKFYFKPIDSHRRHHVPGKLPLKVRSVLGVNDGNVPIEPPSGKIFDFGNVISAFARFSGDQDQTEKRSPSSSNQIEAETSVTPKLKMKSLKRKIPTQEETPLSKKGRKDLFATKKNLLKKLETKSNTSPCYGFESKPGISKMVINNSPFYGFNTLNIEESERERIIVNRLLSKHSPVMIKHNALKVTAPDKGHIIYGQNSNTRIVKNPYKKPHIMNVAASNKSSVAIEKAMQRKAAELKNAVRRYKAIRLGEADIDINRNIPKTSKHISQISANDLRISLNANSRSAKILNTALEADNNTRNNCETYQDNIHETLNNFTDNLKPNIKIKSNPTSSSLSAGLETVPKSIDANSIRIHNWLNQIALADVNVQDVRTANETTSNVKDTSATNEEIIFRAPSNDFSRNTTESPVIGTTLPNRRISFGVATVRKPFINSVAKRIAEPLLNSRAPPTTKNSSFDVKEMLGSCLSTVDHSNPNDFELLTPPDINNDVRNIDDTFQISSASGTKNSSLDINMKVGSNSSIVNNCSSSNLELERPSGPFGDSKDIAKPPLHSNASTSNIKDKLGNKPSSSVNSNRLELGKLPGINGDVENIAKPPLNISVARPKNAKVDLQAKLGNDLSTVNIFDSDNFELGTPPGFNSDVENIAIAPLNSRTKNVSIGMKPEIDPPTVNNVNCNNLELGTPPGIFDSDSEDEVLSKLIETICNPKEVENSTNASPTYTNTKKSVNGISDINLSIKKTKNSSRNIARKPFSKKYPTGERVKDDNMLIVGTPKDLNGDSTIVNSDFEAVDIVKEDRKYSRPSRANKNRQANEILQKTRSTAIINTVESNSKVTDTFTNIKNSPPKVKNVAAKVKPSSSRKIRSIDNYSEPTTESLHQLIGDVDTDQRKVQEESDFELAKKLQAKFDLIQMSSRTRRGAQRQITLEEMLTV